jgi:hypothetical protein
MFYQPPAGFHQPLLQTGQRPRFDSLRQHQRSGLVAPYRVCHDVRLVTGALSIDPDSQFAEAKPTPKEQSTFFCRDDSKSQVRSLPAEPHLGTLQRLLSSHLWNTDSS